MSLLAPRVQAMPEDPTPDQVAHVAEQVAARMRELGYSSRDVYKNSGPAAEVVNNLLVEHRWIKRADARRRLAFALRLQPDGIDRWARGEEAITLDGPTPAEEFSRLTEAVEGLRAQVASIEDQNAELDALVRRALRAIGAKKPPKSGPPGS